MAAEVQFVTVKPGIVGAQTSVAVPPFGFFVTLEHGVPGNPASFVLPYNGSLGAPTSQEMVQVADGLGSFTGFAHAVITAIIAGVEGPASPSVSNAVSGTDSSRVAWNAVTGADSYRVYFFDGSTFDPHSGWGTSTKARFVTHDNSTFDGIDGRDFSVLLHGYTQGTDYKEVLSQMRVPTAAGGGGGGGGGGTQSVVALMLAP